jgi:beta-lactam-binding protein with PASTA domain
MNPRGRLAAVGAVTVSLCALASCASTPNRGQAGPSRTSRTSTTTSQSTSSTSTQPAALSVAVLDVIGMKIHPARFSLRAAGFVPVPLNVPCNKGTLVSQSVVVSLSRSRKPYGRDVGAVRLVPGTTVPRGSRIGVTWSGCYPDGSVVPVVTGLSFRMAVHLLDLAGLTWACYSVGTTTTTTQPGAAITTHPPKRVVLGQGTSAGTVVKPGAPVDLLLSRCPP